MERMRTKATYGLVNRKQDGRTIEGGTTEWSYEDKEGDKVGVWGQRKARWRGVDGSVSVA